MTRVIVVVAPDASDSGARVTRTIRRSHRRAAAKAVVGVLKSGKDCTVRRVVEEVHHLAGGIVGVSCVNPVAQRLEREPTSSIVVVMDDFYARFIRQGFQSPTAVVMVVSSMAQLVVH